MKKILMVILVAVLAVGSSFAQPNMDPAERIQREITGLTDALGLSKDDVAKITPIVTDAQNKQMESFAKMRESGDFDREKMMAERTKLREETDKLLKAVLTPEQGVKLDAFRKQQDEERAKRMQGR